jgi:flagellar basal body-associated protein FliL
MNNTATIRTLAAIIIIIIIIVVVVLIFTSGSLAAAVTSSSTPQPQNLICAHTSNNATCTKEGIISTTTQIPLPMPQQLQPPAALAITRHVIEDIVATISAKDFSIDASGTNVSPQSSFQGAQSPGTATTAVTSKPGTFPVALLQQANATTITAVADHNKCSGGDIITCAYIQETHYPAKDTTTPFVLPIPFP